MTLVKEPSEETEEKPRAVPIADIRASHFAGPIVSTYTYAIRTPNEELVDFIVQVRASKLRSARTYLQLICKDRFNWCELYLSLATLFLGAFLSALLCDFLFSGWRFFLFCGLCPTCAVGTAVAYIFEKKRPEIDTKTAVKAAIDMIQDPENTSEHHEN